MWKEKYEILIKEIAEQPKGTFDYITVDYIPEVLNKCYIVEGDMTFNMRLPDEATEDDYKEFIEYLCDYTGEDLDFYFPKTLRNFKKGN